jgi:hypothetical protein
MNPWVLWIAFIVSGITAAYAQRAYYDATAAAQPQSGIRADTQVSEAIRSNVGRLFQIVFVEVRHRLAALLRRQLDPELERRRWLACISIAVSIVFFVLITLGAGRFE